MFHQLPAVYQHKAKFRKTRDRDEQSLLLLHNSWHLDWLNFIPAYRACLSKGVLLCFPSRTAFYLALYCNDMLHNVVIYYNEATCMWSNIQNGIDRKGGNDDRERNDQSCSHRCSRTGRQFRGVSSSDPVSPALYCCTKRQI